MVSAKSVEHAVGLAILALIALGAFLVLKPFLSAIVWAAVLTYSTWPVFVRLKRRLGDRAALAAAVMILLATCFVITPIAALAWTMTDQVIRLTALARSWFEHGAPSLPSWVADIPLLGGRLVYRWHEIFQKGDLAHNLSPYLGTVRAQLLTVAALVASALFELVLSLLIAFFLYCNGPALSSALGSIGVKLTGRRGYVLINVVAGTVRSVVEGLLAANLLQAILGAIGFWIAGVPGAFLLGFFVFFLTVIPFGTGLVWIPATIWLVNSGQSVSALLLTGWCILIFPVLENVARPYLMRRGSILSAIPLLLGMLGGMSAFGFLGIFLGPALLALVRALLEEWRSPTQKTGDRNYEFVESSVRPSR
jgi:predicted PurR-regulated permease PerM